MKKRKLRGRPAGKQFDLSDIRKWFLKLFGIERALSLAFHGRPSLSRGFTRRQRQGHDGSLVAALPLELAAELLGEAFDQPAAEPGICAFRIDPLTIVRDRKAKLPGRPLERHENRALCIARKAVFDGIRHE